MITVKLNLYFASNPTSLSLSPKILKIPDDIIITHWVNFVDAKIEFSSILNRETIINTDPLLLNDMDSPTRGLFLIF